MQEILPPIPRHIGREESRRLVISAVATKLQVIRIQHDAVRSRLFNADPIVGKAFRGMEVEHPQQVRSFKDEDLIDFVLETDIRLWSLQPTVLLLCELHGAVELVEKPIAQEMVFREIQLPTCIPEGIAISFSGEVEPFWMAKLVALKVEVAFAA